MSADKIDFAPFILARSMVDRGACERWLKSQGIDSKTPSYEAEKERYRTLPLLLDPQLRALSRRVLDGSRGRCIEGTTPFPASLWYGGATKTHDGQRFNGSFDDFVIYVLEARAREVADKRCGWIVTPTTNTDGHRVNASTAAMHALNLDCDGRGTWNRLVEVLVSLDMAFIVYQSGGWTPTSAKWHVLLPLAQAFDTTTPEKISAWKAAYNHARVVLGSVAELFGEGFDPTVETPCQPVFITERRSIEDQPRQVLSRRGRALDLDALMAQLPTVENEAAFSIAGRERPVVNREPVDDDRLEEIIAALVKPMSTILTGRRDLYLCLPGSLLDRGLVPDDVLVIIEEVSLRCPGDPRYTAAEVDSRHREHVHCAQTTIDKYENDDLYTRIGTLATSWPSVANAIDDVLPDATLEAIRKALDVLAGRVPRDATATGVLRASDTTPRSPRPLVAVEPKTIRNRLVSVRGRKRKSKDVNEQVRSLIIDALLNQDDLVPYIKTEDGTITFVEDARGKVIDRDAVINDIVGLIASKVPVTTEFDVVAVILQPSLSKMLKEGESIHDLMRVAERTFVRALGKRVDKEKTKLDTDNKARLDRCL